MIATRIVAVRYYRAGQSRRTHPTRALRSGFASAVPQRAGGKHCRLARWRWVLRANAGGACDAAPISRRSRPTPCAPASPRLSRSTRAGGAPRIFGCGHTKRH
jgi:hypothetical protein